MTKIKDFRLMEWMEILTLKIYIALDIGKIAGLAPENLYWPELKSRFCKSEVLTNFQGFCHIEILKLLFNMEIIGRFTEI